jgi:hypothetical protein
MGDDVIFQIKDFAAIEASMLNYMMGSDNNLTDFNVGSVLRSLVAANASEQETMYFRLWEGIKKAIPESIYTSFGFTKLTGTVAGGKARFSRETESLSDYTIPEGTIIVSPDSYRYITTSEATLLTGTTYIDVSIISANPGSVNNITETGIEFTMETPILGISFVTNSTQITGGTDTETQESIVTKFNQYIQTLQRGTLAAIETGALSAAILDTNGNTTEYVKKVLAVEYADNPGIIDVYIDNGAGGASTALITLAQKIINGYDSVIGDTIPTYIDRNGNIILEHTYDGVNYTNSERVPGYKAAGAVATVSKVVAMDSSVTGTIKIKNGYTWSDVLAFANAAVTDFYNDLDFGETLYLDKLKAAIYNSHKGIDLLTLSTPEANVVPIIKNRRVVLSSNTLTEAT